MVTMLKPRLAASNITRIVPTATVERTRGATWMAIRGKWLRAHPLCAHCEREQKIVIGEEVDHVVPLHLGGADSPTNFQTLCRSHHKAKTASEARARGG